MVEITTWNEFIALSNYISLKSVVNYAGSVEINCWDKSKYKKVGRYTADIESEVKRFEREESLETLD